MANKLRVVTANLCDECKVSNWPAVLGKLGADVVFLQEIGKYNVVALAAKLRMLVLDIDHGAGTAVLVNGAVCDVVDNRHIKVGRKIIYLVSVHLTDIPSVSHHIARLVYKSSQIIPLSWPMSKVLSLCGKNRLPEIRRITRSAAPLAIVAGDFNEPSHLDLKLTLPVSRAMQAAGFIDTYRAMNKAPGYTWPNAGFYRNEPPQRVDYIYTRGFKLISSSVIAASGDHCLVFSTVRF